MRKLFLGALISLQFISHASFAQASIEKCHSKAVKSVEKFVATSHLANRYDKDGIFTVECNLAKNNKAMLCEVGAMKGDGAAVDGFLVVMDLKCRKTFRVQMTGEE